MKPVLLAFVLMVAAGFARAEPAGPSIVSLDYCADQFVLGLADREQILALSTDATKPFSHLRGAARGIRQVRANAEDVIALRPDVVVRSWGGDPRALGFYERLGIRTIQVDYATDIEGTADVTRAVGEAIGQAARAEALLDARPDVALRGKAGAALYITPGGVTAGEGTIIDSLMRAAGLENLADRPGWSSLPLEALVLRKPDVLLMAFFGFDTDRRDQWSVSRHPVMARVVAEATPLALDESRLACPAWFVAEEAAAITAALETAP